MSILLMAAWTEAALLAGEGDEHLVAAVGATDAGEAEVQIAAAKESAGHLTDDRTPRAVAAGVALVVGPLEIAEVNLDGLVQRRMTWPARPVNRGGLCGETDHGNATLRIQCGKGGDTAVDFSAEGYKSTLYRWREVSGGHDRHGTTAQTRAHGRRALLRPTGAL